MKRIFRILGFTLVITTLLVVFIASTVFASTDPNGPNPDCEPVGDGPFGPFAGNYGPNGPNPDCEPIGDGPFGPFAGK